MVELPQLELFWAHDDHDTVEPVKDGVQLAWLYSTGIPVQ